MIHNKQEDPDYTRAVMIVLVSIAYFSGKRVRSNRLTACVQTRAPTCAALPAHTDNI